MKLEIEALSPMIFRMSNLVLKNEKAIAKNHPPTPSKATIKKIVVEYLSFAQLNAFQLLTRYGVKI